MNDEINKETAGSEPGSVPPPLPPLPISQDGGNKGVEESSFTTKVTDQVTEWAGVERLEGFKLG
jgi:hypothetical protein